MNSGSLDSLARVSPGPRFLMRKSRGRPYLNPSEMPESATSASISWWLLICSHSRKDRWEEEDRAAKWAHPSSPQHEAAHAQQILCGFHLGPTCWRAGDELGRERGEKWKLGHTGLGWRWASQEETAHTCICLFFFFYHFLLFFISNFNFKYSTQIQISVLKFRFPISP
jgi:hypothetical protein